MLLDQQSQSALISRITGGGGEKEPARVGLETTQVESKPSEQRESQSQQNYQRVEESSSEPKQIPYDRFKKVNETKKEYQRRYEEQQVELDRLRKELDSKSSNRVEDDDWLKEILYPEDPTDKKFKDLESRIQTYELREAEKELDSIVKSAVRRNSDLDNELVESVVYNTIATNPNADVDEAIGKLREFVDYVETRGKKKTESQTPNNKPVAPPRPSMAGSKNYQTTPETKPRSLADAREALYNFLSRK